MEAAAWERTLQEFQAVSCWKVWSSPVEGLQIIRIIYTPDPILDLIIYYTAMFTRVHLHAIVV